MTRKVFTKLLALFVLLLVFQMAAMELIFRSLIQRAADDTLPRLGREALWSGLIALAVALPLAAWAASGITSRLQRVVTFARRMAQGDLTARLAQHGGDELAAMEAALNQTAERLVKILPRSKAVATNSRPCWSQCRRAWSLSPPKARYAGQTP